MTNNTAEERHKEILGREVDGIICKFYHVLADVLVVEDAQQNARAVDLSHLPHKVVLYEIEGSVVKEVMLTANRQMFLFSTDTRQYLVNNQNQVVEDSTEWADAYFESLSSSFYRKSARGFWYDLEGFKLEEKIFLKGDVLTSLYSKASKQSVLFKNQSLYVSKNKRLIQIGKLVFNQNLDTVNYFGEKITGLGTSNVSLGDDLIVQEVKLGLSRTVFIDEYTHEPYLFRERRVLKHLGSHEYGQRQIELFQTDEESFGVDKTNGQLLSYNDKPLHITQPEYVHFNNCELIKVSDGQKQFYFDLNNNKAFSPNAAEKITISSIDNSYVRIGHSKLFNVSTPKEEFVIVEEDGSSFTLNDGALTPQKIEDPSKYVRYFGFAYIDGQRKLFSKSQARVCRFGKDELEVAEMKIGNSDKLINAIDIHGNNLVLDIRQGFDEVSMAETEGLKILETYGEVMSIGSMRLQHVLVETLGGHMKRVIDINDAALPSFTLPKDLTQISDQELMSVFAGNYIAEIIFSAETYLEGRAYVNATFQSFTGKEYSVILDKSTGRPLHLQGLGYRNELASVWVTHTLQKYFYLGDNRMVGVRTISENLKENELLLSVQQASSWLAFGDGYLPIFKQLVEIEDTLTDTWDYHLLELRQSSAEKEYVAVEKKPPYRLLVQGKGNDLKPKIVKSAKKSIKSPEGLNALQKFFSIGTGTLVNVE